MSRWRDIELNWWQAILLLAAVFAVTFAALTTVNKAMSAPSRVCMAKISQPTQVVHEVQFTVTGSCPRARGYAARIQVRNGPTDFGPWIVRNKSWRGNFESTKVRATISFLGKPVKKNRIWIAHVEVWWFLLDGTDGKRIATTTGVLFKLK